MEVVGLLLPFVLLGIGVVFIAFSGGPGRAREVYLTRGGRGFRIGVAVVFVVGGVVVPGVILANRDASAGNTDSLRDERLTSQEQEGKQLFRQSCASCHNLDAANARGVTGPDLDEVGEVSEKRIVTAIRIGGTGQKRMPSGILAAEEAKAVGAYVAKVAGK